MFVAVTRSGLKIDGETFFAKILIFLDSTFRGIAQVMFQNNSYAGILFLLGLFLNSLLFGSAALVGALFGTLSAYLFGLNFSDIRDGLYGFNGALTAIAIAYFFEPSFLMWVYLIIAASTSTILMAAAQKIFSTWEMPALTAPFVFTTLIFLLACTRFGRLHTTNLFPSAGLPELADVKGVVTFMTFGEGLFHGVSQVFFQENIVTAILFLIGLLISSKKDFVMALVGSAIGFFCAWLLGGAEQAIHSGVFGFNSVLTAIALGNISSFKKYASFIFVGLGCVVTAIAFAAISGAFQPIGMPAMTAPFVIVTWIFIFSSQKFSAAKLK